MDLSRQIADLRAGRVALRKDIVLLTGTMPPGSPEECRRQAHGATDAPDRSLLVAAMA